MGNYFHSPLKAEVQEPTSTRKRTIEDIDEEKDKLQEENLHTPKRKKLKTTSKYIYKTLFLNGENSDVTIVALGREWPLHKVYLCQSGYFASMFSGCWKETNQSVIDMHIPDQNIHVEALQVAFGSLYRDDVLIKPANVVSVLAAATLLSLDGLIQQCADIMTETISAKTVCKYHEASVLYGKQLVTKKCIDWLEKNIMTSQSASLLREISIELMEQIVGSSDLFVIQVEMDIYAMLKKWMFLQLVPSWTGSSKHLGSEADSYFKKYSQEMCFLETEMGEVYSTVFHFLRFQHVINDIGSAKLIEEDRIVPKSWLMQIYKSQWLQMLQVEYEKDKGPEEKYPMDFLQLSTRCGRVLVKDGVYCWRWTGYNYGIDVLVTFSNRLIIFKRNTRSQNCPYSVSLQAKRSIMLRVVAASFDGLGQTQYIKSSGVMWYNLGPDEEAVVMSVDRQAPFPLHISVNLLVYTPAVSSRRKWDLNKSSMSSQSSPSSSLSNSPEGSHDSNSLSPQGSQASTLGTPSRTPDSARQGSDTESDNRSETDHSLETAENNPDQEEAPLPQLLQN